jgi:hypothetical protein
MMRPATPRGILYPFREVKVPAGLEEWHSSEARTPPPFGAVATTKRNSKESLPVGNLGIDRIAYFPNLVSNLRHCSKRAYPCEHHNLHESSISVNPVYKDISDCL